MNLHSPAPTPSGGFEAADEAKAVSTEGVRSLDLRRVTLAFRRRLRLFGAVALLIFVVTVLITLQATPKYTAAASVMLDTRKEKVTTDEAVLSGLPADSASVDTEVEVIRSRQLAERVVSSLKLDNDPEFSSALRKPHGARAILSGLRKALTNAAPTSTASSPQLVRRRHEAVVDSVLSRLGVRRSGLTYVIRLEFTSEEPEKAAAIVNKYAELYLLEQLEAKFEATQQATNWLNGRLGELRNQVLSDEAAVQQYKIANNLLSASGTSLTEQEISNYNQTLAQAQAQVAEDEARLSTARRQLATGSTGDDVGEALSSPVIQQLRSQRASVSAQVADLQGRYGERHPEMLKAKRQLSDLDAQIQQEIQRIISNLEARATVSRQRAAALSGSLGGARGALAANNRAMVRLNELQRTAEASRTLYESYLARYKETSTQQGIEQSDARVVSRAKTPTSPSAPKVELNILVGLLLALGGGLMAVVLAETLDSGLATAEDVESRLGTSYLGSVPLLASVSDDTTLAPGDFLVAKPLSSFAEAFRGLRTSIQYARLGVPVKIVAVTSALPGEGKTTTSLCLGRGAALQGARVIVLDCDLRRRAMNRLFGTETDTGLLEVLSGEATLDQAIVADAETGAHFLPLSRRPFTPRDVFGSDAMDRLLDELRARYDLVVLDTAPLLPIADTRVLAPKADAVVFLARWRKTPQQAVYAALRMLDGTGAHIGGIALTQVDMKQQSKYGYGDPGYYYAEYKKYYAA